MRLEGLGQLKISMTSSGIEPETFRLCSIVPQPATLPRVHKSNGDDNIEINLGRSKMCRCGLDSNGSDPGPIVGSCEHGTERSSSIKGGEFRDQLSHCNFSRRILIHDDS
jgi:hypothetical protein